MQTIIQAFQNGLAYKKTWVDLFEVLRNSNSLIFLVNVVTILVSKTISFSEFFSRRSIKSYLTKQNKCIYFKMFFNIDSLQKIKENELFS